MTADETPPEGPVALVKKRGPYTKLEIDPGTLEAIAALRPTYLAVADHFGISLSTFQRRLRASSTLREAWKRGKANTDILIRQAVLDRALDPSADGSTRCLLFLAQRLPGMMKPAATSNSVADTEGDDMLEEQNEEAVAIEEASRIVSGWTPEQIKRYADTGIEPGPSASEEVIEAEIVTPPADGDERAPV